MGKSTTKSATQATTAPNPQLQQAYSGLVNQAQGIASTPLQLYQGNTVAPFSQQQQQAFGQISGAQGIQDPYISSAQNLINSGAAPITAPGALSGTGIAGLTNQATNLATNAANTNIWGQLPQFNAQTLNQYQSPYTSDVVNATQQQFNLQNAQQQQGLTGSAIASGAYGGDRSAIAAAALAGQQQTAQAPVIAGLEQSGYNTALGEFNSQQAAQQSAIAQQAGLQAQGAQTLYGIGSGQQQAGIGTQEASASNALYGGYGIAGLGNQALNESLTGSSALLNAGGLQQQQAQEQLNVPYEQYLQQQAYPYQQTDYLSSILGGTNLGQTTTQQTSQQQPFSLLRRGGHVPHMQGGGVLNFNPYAFFEQGFGSDAPSSGGTGNPAAATPTPTPASAPPDQSTGYVPAAQPGAATHTSAPTAGMGGAGGGAGGQQQQSLASQAMQGVNAYNTLSDAFSGGSAALSPVSITPEVTSSGGFLGGVGNSGALGIGGTGGLLDEIGSGLSAAGSGIADAAEVALAFIGLNKGGRARKYDDGGSVDVVHPEEPAPIPVSGIAAQPVGDLLPADQTPDAWKDIATHVGQPTVLPEQPQDFWQRIGFAPTQGHMEGTDFVPGDPGWGRSALAGIGSALEHRSLGAGLIGALNEHENEEELDDKPTVDHSGATVRIFYPSEKRWIDTGLPSEAALNAQAMAQYRMGSLDERSTRDQDTDTYHQEEVQRQTEADAERARNEAEIAGIRADLANQGKYGAMTPGKGRDAQGNVVDGIYTLNEKTGQPVFTPGGELTAKPPSGVAPPMTGNGAMEAAQRDYDRLYPAPKPDPSNPTAPLQPRRAPPEGMQTWLQKRAQAYMGGEGATATSAAVAPPLRPSNAPAASPAPAAATPAAPAAPAPVRTPPPPLPPTVPPGSMWSPSRKQFRDPGGRLYNAQGQRITG